MDKESKEEPLPDKNIISGFKINQISGNLFLSTDSLAHCVDKQFHMGKGIATNFRQEFGSINLLLNQNKGVGDFAYLRDHDRFIFYLITKEKHFYKPTYRALFKCLINLRKFMELNHIVTLAMPRIGCGLDSLKWSVVLQGLKKIFWTSNIKITIWIN